MPTAIVCVDVDSASEKTVAKMFAAVTSPTCRYKVNQILLFGTERQVRLPMGPHTSSLLKKLAHYTIDPTITAEPSALTTYIHGFVRGLTAQVSASPVKDALKPYLGPLASRIGAQPPDNVILLSQRAAANPTQTVAVLSSEEEVAAVFEPRASGATQVPTDAFFRMFQGGANREDLMSTLFQSYSASL